MIRTNTDFEKFVRVRRGSWKWVDEKEWRKESNSVSVIATDGIARVQYQAKKVVRPGHLKE
jgi:hypothetical protein